MKLPILWILLLCASGAAHGQPQIPIEKREGRTILLIGAHPDDDTYSMGTLAMLNDHKEPELSEEEAAEVKERLRSNMEYRDGVPVEGFRYYKGLPDNIGR